MPNKIAEELLPDNYPSVEQEPLSLDELQVKAHWERFLPKTVATFKKQGPLALDTAIRAAWWRTQYHIELAQHQNPKLSSLQAEAMFRNQWLYLPPETPTTPASRRPTTSSPPSASEE